MQQLAQNLQKYLHYLAGYISKQSLSFIMKKLFFLSAGLAFIAVFTCQAQSHRRITLSSEKSLLWKISGNGLKTPSYLFGTIHLICSENFLWTPAMQRAFDASEKVAFEMDMDDPNVMMSVGAGMMLPDTLSLKNYFNPKDYQRLEKYAQDTLNVPAITLERLQPFAILSMAMMAVSPCTGEPISYEQKISGWATQQHKEILGLESANEQLAVINDMNKDSTARQVIQLLNHPETPKKQYQTLLAAFLKQDLNRLYQLILKAPDMTADLNTLLFQRNKKWIPEIKQMIAQQATFIAVGSGHLAGPEGVIALLRQEGYIVQPIH